MSDVDTLTRVLQERFSQVVLRPDFGWPNPPLNVIDCVLSLNRRYKGFVLPRVQMFLERHPEIVELGHLRRAVGQGQCIHPRSRRVGARHEQLARVGQLHGPAERGHE